MSKREIVACQKRNSEWYTPPVYIDAMRTALGSIQFDPLSCEVANTLFGADDYYTASDDATMTPWPVVQTVFANPPYERGLIGRCIKTIIANYRANDSATIVLVNVATDARWFQMALGSCNAVCFTAKRIRFVKSDGITMGGSNTRG
jgi:16S rRNA G966 N2-methylase RsmD